VSYSLSEHRHRFAVWAAARAAQRGFTTINNLRHALEATDIRKVLATPGTLEISSAGFARLHRKWCSSICSSLSNRHIANVTYGRAAKLVAVYLKTVIVMGADADSAFCRHLHPPIDRVLMRALASSAIESPHKAEWRFVNWTQLTATTYYELIRQLHETLPPNTPFWTIEEFWQPTDDRP
jgi:hypothetical protein